jgi:WD40 repeat protein
MTYRTLSVGIALLAAFLAPMAASAQQPQPIAHGPPSAKPFLRVDPGMHTAPVRQIAAGANCSLLATGSEDKSVRLWRVRDGKLVPMSTLRPPIGPDNDGKVNAVAMAPDGAWLAVGGWNRTGGDHWVYIFQTATGRILTRLGRVSVIERLAVSRDGRYLAAALRAPDGLRVWRRDDADGTVWQLVLQSRKDAQLDVKGVAFDAGGALYTVAYDGKLRRYPPGFKSEPRTVLTRGGRQPYTVAVHPDGDLVAVGFADEPVVDIYDAKTLAWRSATPSVGPGRSNLSSVAWSSDGQRLYAGGTYSEGGRFVVREWSDRGGGTARNIPGPTDAVLDLVPCANGIAVAGGDPAFGLIGPAGTREFWQGAVGADMRGNLREHFLVSADGSRVRFRLTEKAQPPVLFDLGGESLSDSAGPAPDLLAAKTDGLPIADWENGGAPKLAGRPLGLDRYEKAQSLAVAANGSRFVLGTGYYLRAYGQDGVLLWKRQAPGVVWGLNLAHNDNLVVAACGDGTVRWYRMDTGEELLALFVLKDDRRWIAWTQSGYFTASVGGENLIGWQVNRSWTEAPDFYPVSRFRDQYRRPDVVMGVLAELDEAKAVRRANLHLNINKTDAVRDLRRQLPPLVRIVSPADYAPISGSELSLAYVVRSPSRLKVKRVFAEIGGRPVEGAEERSVRLDAADQYSGTLKIALPKGDVAVSVVAETDEVFPRRSQPATVNLLRVGTPAPPTDVQPRLFGLIVGIGKYEDPSLDLGDFPGTDADRIAAQLKLQEGPGLAFEKVETRVLKHRTATKERIEYGLQWLLDQVKDRDDVALFYFSGHGMSVTGSSSFILPADHKPNMLVRALNKQTILQYLDLIRGRVVVFIDACYAADGLELAKMPGAQRLIAPGLVNEFAERGIISFASSSGKERSYAEGDYSYFTKALIEGLKGQGRRFQTDTQVLTTGLGDWLAHRVNGLSDGKQNPVMLASPLTKPVPLANLK